LALLSGQKLNTVLLIGGLSIAVLGSIESAWDVPQISTQHTVFLKRLRHGAIQSLFQVWLLVCVVNGSSVGYLCVYWVWFCTRKFNLYGTFCM